MACFSCLHDYIMNVLVATVWHCYLTMSLFEKVLWDVLTALLHKLLALSELFVASLFLLFKKILQSRLTQFSTRIHWANTKNLASVSDSAFFLSCQFFMRFSAAKQSSQSSLFLFVCLSCCLSPGQAEHYSLVLPVFWSWQSFCPLQFS